MFKCSYVLMIDWLHTVMFKLFNIKIFKFQCSSLFTLCWISILSCNSTYDLCSSIHTDTGEATLLKCHNFYVPLYTLKSKCPMSMFRYTSLFMPWSTIIKSDNCIGTPEHEGIGNCHYVAIFQCLIMFMSLSSRETISSWLNGFIPWNLNLQITLIFKYLAHQRNFVILNLNVKYIYLFWT